MSNSTKEHIMVSNAEPVPINTQCSQDCTATESFDSVRGRRVIAWWFMILLIVVAASAILILTVPGFAEEPVMAMGIRPSEATEGAPPVPSHRDCRALVQIRKGSVKSSRYVGGRHHFAGLRHNAAASQTSRETPTFPRESHRAGTIGLPSSRGP